MRDVPLPYFFRIDYYSTRKNGRVNQRQRLHVKNVERWEDLLSSIMDGTAKDPDTNEIILFDKILRMEKVNRSVGIGDKDGK